MLTSCTSAFGTTAPEGSSTVPATAPVVEDCARTQGATTATPHIARTTVVHTPRGTLTNAFCLLIKSLLPSLSVNSETWGVTRHAQAQSETPTNSVASCFAPGKAPSDGRNPPSDRWPVKQGLGDSTIESHRCQRINCRPP